MENIVGGTTGHLVNLNSGSMAFGGGSSDSGSMAFGGISSGSSTVTNNCIDTLITDLNNIRDSGTAKASSNDCINTFIEQLNNMRESNLSQIGSYQTVLN